MSGPEPEPEASSFVFGERELITVLCCTDWGREAFFPQIETLSDIMTLRLANRFCAGEIRAWFRTYPCTHLETGSTWLAVGQCWHCEREREEGAAEFKQLAVPYDFPLRRTVVSCRRWRCWLAALKSLLHTIESDNAVLLRHRIFRDRIIIPRASGRTSHGHVVHGVLFVVEGELSARCEWTEGTMDYHKCVPLRFMTSSLLQVIDRAPALPLEPCAHGL
jgi:hypothetical protein